MGTCVHPMLGSVACRARGPIRHPIPNTLLCLPALQSPHLPKEQEPAGAPLEGMRRLGAPARLPPADFPVPEHPQVRTGQVPAMAGSLEGSLGPCWGVVAVGTSRGVGMGMESRSSEGNALEGFVQLCFDSLVSAWG